MGRLIIGNLVAHPADCLRVCYGIVLFFQLTRTFPHARRYYTSRRWGGYLDSSPFSDRVHTPPAANACMVLWCLCALGIVFDHLLLAAALLNLLLARYFFVDTRWRGILRGMGAPGHMTYWLACLIFLLALSRRCAGGDVLRQVTIAVFRLDFACIMIVAGISKIAAGYPRNDGFQIGLANPWWGHRPALAARFPANGIFYRALNHAAYLGEILGGFALLIPSTAPYGAAVLALNFLMIGRVIRLTGLAEMVAVCCLIFLPGLNTVMPVNLLGSIQWISLFTLVPSIALIVYAMALPFAYFGMAINFYGRRTLPRPLQRALDAWTRCFGLTLWRVFTPDIVNFFCEISAEREGKRTPIQGERFTHVAEFITLASIFTTLRYHANDPDLFQRRLLTYAATLPGSNENLLIFRYIRILKEQRRFRFRPIAEFTVDLAGLLVRETVLDSALNVRHTDVGSPVYSSNAKPGSYGCA